MVITDGWFIKEQLTVVSNRIINLPLLFWSAAGASQTHGASMQLMETYFPLLKLPGKGLQHTANHLTQNNVDQSKVSAFFIKILNSRTKIQTPSCTGNGLNSCSTGTTWKFSVQQTTLQSDAWVGENSSETPGASKPKKTGQEV